MLYTVKFLQNRKNQGKAEGFVNVDVLNSSGYLSRCTCCLGKVTASIVSVEF